MVKVGSESFGTGTYENIPVGTKLRMSVFDIDKVKVAGGDNKGKDQFSVTFKVTEDGSYKGREIRYNNIPLYEGRGAWVLVTFAEAVGWDVDKASGGIDVPDNYKSVLGTELLVTVGERTSQTVDPNTGKPRVYNTAARYAKAGAAEDKPVAVEASWSDV